MPSNFKDTKPPVSSVGARRPTICGW